MKTTVYCTRILAIIMLSCVLMLALKIYFYLFLEKKCVEFIRCFPVSTFSLYFFLFFFFFSFGWGGVGRRLQNEFTLHYLYFFKNSPCNTIISGIIEYFQRSIIIINDVIYFYFSDAINYYSAI